MLKKLIFFKIRHKIEYSFTSIVDSNLVFSYCFWVALRDLVLLVYFLFSLAFILGVNSSSCFKKNSKVYFLIKKGERNGD